MSKISGRVFLGVSFILGLWAVVYAEDMLTLDMGKSRIDFVGTKPGALHRGGFKQFTVDAAVNWGDLSKSSFKIGIDTASLWSDNNGLTNHLQNADFFYISRYPTIEFEISRIELGNGNKAVVTGTLTMLGKPVEVAIPCSVEATDGSLKAKCDFKIDRTRWGMNYGQGRVDNEVEIAARFVFGR